MVEIVTHSDLYVAVLQLLAQYRESTRSLEVYLLALWSAALQYRERAFLTPNEFFGVLTDAFSEEPYPCEPELWLEIHGDISASGLENAPGYRGWEFRVRRQVIDLQEMEIGGRLDDGMRYFGIDAPRGSRWCNFTPGGYLERAMAGTFTGCDWEEDDPDREITVLTKISWEQFRDFLQAGQEYE